LLLAASLIYYFFSLDFPMNSLESDSLDAAYKYWAFISYSHIDEKWADWLHKELETYRAPGKLVATEKVTSPLPRRIYPIFRDREELPVSADLGTNIQQALRQSRFLVVICSPRSARSRWVNQEIKYFKSLGRESHVLALIVDGEPNAIDGKPGFQVDDECFPEALRYQMGENGELSPTRTEPVAGDAREGKDGKANAKLRLLSGLLGVNYDALRQREQQRRRRFLAFAAATASTIALAMSVLAWVALGQAKVAQTQRDRANVAVHHQKQLLEQASWSSFNQADLQMERGEWREGLTHLARAIKFNPENSIASERFFGELMVLHEKVPVLLAVFPHQSSFYGVLSNEVSSATFSPDGNRILTLNGQSAKLWDLAGGKELFTLKHEDNVALVNAVFSPDGTRILTTSDGRDKGDIAKVWNSASGKELMAFQICEPHNPKYDEETVRNAVFSPDGARILTNSLFGPAKTWDAASGKRLFTFAPNRSNQSAILSPDGAHILLFGSSGGPELWDTVSGKKLVSFSSEGGFDVAVFSPDGSRVFGASGTTGIVWDTLSGKELVSISTRARVSLAAFSPDGTSILTVSETSASLFDSTSGKELPFSFSDKSRIKSVAFSPNGTRLVTTSDDHTAKVWDTYSGAELLVIPHQKPVNTAAFNPDGSHVVTASGDGTAKLWDAASTEPLSLSGKQVRPHFSNDFRDPVFSPNGECVLTTSLQGPAELWDTAANRRLVSFFPPTPVLDAAFSQDGARIVTVSTYVAKVWNVASGRELFSYPSRAEISNSRFNADATRILVECQDHSAKLLDVTSGKELLSLPPQDNEHVAFSPDWTRILATLADGTAKLWDAASGRELRSLSGGAMIQYIAFSTDGVRVLASCSDKTVKIFDTASGKLLLSFANQDMARGVCTPDSSRILTASDGIAKLWDMASGKELFTFPSRDRIAEAVFSPNGTRVFTRCDKNDRSTYAALWDLTSGKKLFSLDSATENDADVTYNPVGTRILTNANGTIHDFIDRSIARQPSTVRLWDVTSGRELLTFDEFDLRSAVFSPDGRRLLIGSATVEGQVADADKEVHLPGSIKLWDTLSAKELLSFPVRAVNSMTVGPDGITPQYEYGLGGSGLKAAVFSPDDSRVLISYARMDGKEAWTTAELWDVGTPRELAALVKKAMEPVSGDQAVQSQNVVLLQQINLLAELATGVESTADGQLIPLSGERLLQVKQELLKFGGDSDPLGLFITWFCSSEANRPLFPRSKATVADCVDNALLTTTDTSETWLRNALRCFPNNPLLLIRLASFAKNTKSAEFLCNLSIAKNPGNAQAMLEMGKLYMTGEGLARDPEKAVAWLEKSADTGSDAAMFYLGRIYLYGIGIPGNYNKAYQWFKRGSDAGNFSALNGLGALYSNGYGVSQDLSKAFDAFQRSAAAGNVLAMYNLAKSYDAGEGVTQDSSKAFAWYQNAADAGNAMAMTILGKLYESGRGVPQDYLKAFAWYQQASDAGDPDACYHLGLLYYEGNGVKKDSDQAWTLFQQAAHGGSTLALTFIGGLYYGAGDYNNARDWFQKAVDAGNVRAMYCLGYLYEHGQGVPQDYSKARQWYQKAADAGDNDAKQTLLRLK
jgi:WD40 repeat protein/TPR repeat protein